MAQNAFLYLTKKFVAPYWRWYLGGVISLALTSYITISVPKLAKLIINEWSKTSSHDSPENKALLIIGLGLALILVRIMSRVLIFWPGRKVEMEVKMHYFQHIVSLPKKFFASQAMGDLISRLSSDVGQLRVFYAFALLNIFNLFFLSGSAFYQMLKINVSLTYLTLIPLFCVLLLSKLLTPYLQKFSRVQQESLGELSNSVTEAFTHVRTIQLHSVHEPFAEKIGRRVNRVYQANIKTVFLRTLLYPLANFFTGISYLAVLFYGGVLILQQEMTVGDLLAFNIYIALLGFPLTAIGFIIAIYHRAKAATERLVALELNSPELVNEDHSHTFKANSPIIEIKNLNYAFSGNGNKENILNNIDLSINQGERVGITGPLASGKSTLFHLLTKLYDPPEGALFFKGIDIKSVHCSEIRKKIAYVLQNPYLFFDSIRGNIELANCDGVSFDAMIHATKNAQIYDDIGLLPHKWESLIGERGIQLSGGQRKRLALAQAYIRQAEILLIDDVTNAVDEHTEKQILDNLQFSQTQIIISHRPQTLKVCDSIVILDKGKLIGRGLYQDLENTFPQYFSKVI